LAGDLNEKLLIARVRSTADREAYAELVAANQSRLRLFLQRLCHDSHLADDLAQETFLTAFQKIGSYTGSGSFQGWLIRIAHRHFLLHLRQGARELAVLAEYQQSLDTGPERFAGLSALQADLEKAMAGLTHGEAAALTLCHSFGYSHQEAAGILDLPLGTVKSQVRRGLEKLRLLLSDFAESARSDVTGGPTAANSLRKQEVL